MRTRISMSMKGQLSQQEADILISGLHRWAREHGLPPVRFRAEVFETIEVLTV